MQKRVSALNFQLVKAIREAGREGTREITYPLLPLSSPELCPGVCTAAELRFQRLLPAQQCTPITPPRQAGTEEMLNQGSSCTANTLHLSLDANSGSGFFVYLLLQVLCKASCLFMWQPGAPVGFSVQGWLYWGQPANRSKNWKPLHEEAAIAKDYRIWLKR